MTPLEAAALCRFTKAVCPQQAIDEYTPDAWHELLKDLNFQDAKDAVVTVGQNQPFVAPAEIRAEVRRVRNGRLSDFGHLPPPPADLGDDEQARWLRALRRRIADGEVVQVPAIEGVEKPRELDFANVFRSVDDEDDHALTEARETLRGSREVGA